MSNANTEGALRANVQRLERNELSHKKMIRTQKREIQRLRDALAAFTKQDSSSSEDDAMNVDPDPKQDLKEWANQITALLPSTNSREVPNAEDSDSEESQTEEEYLSGTNPILEEDSGVRTYRCSKCAWEIVYGFCHGCGLGYDIPDNLTDDANRHRSVTTDDEIFRHERNMAPRGNTPSPPPPETTQLKIPEAYVGTETQYRELISRGATESMCLAFKLEFTHQTGILAWADKRIRKSFAGESIQEDDMWGIHLGRCVELEKDDPDGFEFLSNLLEEVLLFNPWGRRNDWTTNEETPGIWITAPLTEKYHSDEEESEDEVDELEEDFEPEGDPDAIKPNRYSNEAADEAEDDNFDIEQYASDTDSADSDFGVVYSDEEALSISGSPTVSSVTELGAVGPSVVDSADDMALDDDTDAESLSSVVPEE